MLRRTHRLVQWLVLGALVGVASGAASALFLWLLDLATGFRTDNEAIVWTLPVAGIVLGLLLQKWGGPVRGGNNLVIDSVHERSERVPVGVAPAILGGTVLTHLFGGSAGREGAAVQMGATLADEISHRLRVRKSTRRELLAAGVAGGFGSVFGTPVAGAVFGLEVVHLGRIEYTALVPALVASVVGDLTARALGARHSVFPQVPELAMDPVLLLKWILLGIIVAAVSVLFIEATHRLRSMLERIVPALWLRMFFGGLAVVALWQLVGSSEYLGLGVPFIERALAEPLGNALAGPLGLPLALTAGVCMAAMFAAASNTPLALSIMAVELLGGGVFPHVVVVCVVAYLLTGHRSIYPSQLLLREKWAAASAERCG